MAFNGSGTYLTLTAPTYPALTGQVVNATYFNAQIDDMAAALSTCLTKDGQTTPTANIPLGGFSLTGVGGVTLASGAALNWGAGNYTVTHSAGNLTFSGATTFSAAATFSTTIGVTGVATATGGLVAGTAAPTLKFLKLTGTTPDTVDTDFSIAHGLAASKILSVEMSFLVGGVYRKPSRWSQAINALYIYEPEWDATNITMTTGPNWTGNFAPYTLLITYEA